MTTITDPSAARVQLAFLRGHLRLMALGMTHSKMSRSALLKKVTAITGRTYRSRGGIEQALADVNELLS